MFTFIITILVVIFFWPRIRNFISTSLSKFLRERLGETFADYFTDVVAWLDKKIRGIRRGFKEAWLFVKKRILRMDTEVMVDGNMDCVSKDTTLIDMGNGKVGRIVETHNVVFDELPEEIQREIIKQNFATDGYRHGKLDNREVIQTMAAERLKEDKKLPQTEEEATETTELETLMGMN